MLKRYHKFLILALLLPLHQARAGLINGASLVNGGFETGDLTGWTQAAYANGFQSATRTVHQVQSFQSGMRLGQAANSTNGVITSQTKDFTGQPAGTAISPTSGQYMAFLSTATRAGELTLTGSSLSQTFVVPVGAADLAFDVRFLSNERIGDPWDYSGITLSQGTSVLAQLGLDHATTSAADVHATATPLGGFRDSTPWINSSFDLSRLWGQSVTVMAYVTNNSDESIESRLLLDNVRVDFAVVPEPASGILAGIGLLCVAGIVGRRRYRRQV